MKSTRPKYLNLLRIHQPLPALVSFGHRVSGALLFLGIPLLLLALQAVLSGATESFAHPLFRAALFVVLSAYAFHFFAGLRFLLLDLHWGGTLQGARRTAALVGMMAMLGIVALGVWLW